MILNMYLTSEWSQSKSDFVLAVLHIEIIDFNMKSYCSVNQNGLIIDTV